MLVEASLDLAAWPGQHVTACCLSTLVSDDMRLLGRISLEPPQAPPRAVIVGELWSGTRAHLAMDHRAEAGRTTASTADPKPFTDLTGINVRISQMELGRWCRRWRWTSVPAGRRTKRSTPTRTRCWLPAPTASSTSTRSSRTRTSPSPAKGIADFIPTQLEATGRFADADKLFASPYDCPTMIWVHRKDIFDKFGTQTSNDLGSDAVPSESTTWDQYYRTAKWFKHPGRRALLAHRHRARRGRWLRAGALERTGEAPPGLLDHLDADGTDRGDAAAAVISSSGSCISSTRSPA